MNLRSVVVWCAFVVVAIVNGGLRDAVLTPQLGEFGGHITSTILLCPAGCHVADDRVDSAGKIDGGAADWGSVGPDDRCF